MGFIKSVSGIERIVGGGFLAIITVLTFVECRRFFGWRFDEMGFDLREAYAEALVVLLVAVPVMLIVRRLLSRLHYLEGLLSVCAWCRKVDHGGEWIPMDQFLKLKFSTDTSHGIWKNAAIN